jgi:hypothetical protein
MNNTIEQVTGTQVNPTRLGSKKSLLQEAQEKNNRTIPQEKGVLPGSTPAGKNHTHRKKGQNKKVSKNQI